MLGFGLGWEGPGAYVSIDATGPLSYAGVSYVASEDVEEERDFSVFTSCIAIGNTRLVRRYRLIHGGETQAQRAPCPRGTKVTGGGSGTFGPKPVSRPYDGGDRKHVPDDGWLVKTSYDQTSSTWHVVQAVCLKV